MHETFIWKPTEGWDISSCDISYSLRFTPRQNSCEGSSFPFPLNVFSPFLSFFGSLIIFSRMPSELSDCRYLCDRDLLGNTQKKKKCCKIKQQKDGESRGTEVRNVDKWTCYPTRPWHRSESPAATLQQSWTSLHASQLLSPFFPASPFCLCILHLAVNFPSAPGTACYLNYCSVRQNTLITAQILMTQV